MQRFADFTGKSQIGQVVYDRLVVFVNQNGNRFSGLTVKFDNQFLQFAGNRPGLKFHAAIKSDKPQTVGQRLIDKFNGTVCHGAEINAHYGMFPRPVPLIVNVKSPEKIFPGGKKAVERAYQQGFAESARTRQEVGFAGGYHPVDVFRFIYIQKAVCAKILKRLYAYG